jgi:hypothetical protein
VDPKVAVADVVIALAFLDNVSTEDVIPLATLDRLSSNELRDKQEPPVELLSFSMRDMSGGLA